MSKENYKADCGTCHRLVEKLEAEIKELQELNSRALEDVEIYRQACAAAELKMVLIREAYAAASLSRMRGT